MTVQERINMTGKLQILEKTIAQKDVNTKVLQADYFDDRPVGGLGAISQVKGQYVKTDEFFPDVTLTYANATASNTLLAIGDPIGMVAGDAGLTVVAPDTCDFSGGYAAFKQYLGYRGLMFNGFNYEVDNVAQQANVFRYYFTAGNGTESRKFNPKAYKRNTPNDPNIQTFDVNIFLGLNQLFTLVVSPGRTVTITLYVEGVYNAYAK